MIMEYFSNKQKIIKIEKEIEMELNCIKVELLFIGKNNELEIYTEYFEGNNMEESPICISERVSLEMSSNYIVSLKNNRKVLNLRYYTLMKLDIKDVKKVKKLKKVFVLEKVNLK